MDATNEDALRAELTRDEGLRLLRYADSLGNETIGIGHNLAKPISRRAALVIYEDDKADALADLDRALPWWRTMSDVRQRVLANMCFNMGLGNATSGLLSFKNTLAAMQRGDYKAASAGMLASTWAKQTGSRAIRLAAMMLAG